MSNHTRFFQIVGAVLLLLSLFSGEAFGQGTPVEDFDPNNWQSSLGDDQERGLAGSNTLLRPVTLTLGYAFGHQRTLDRGNEAFFDTNWHFLFAEAMFHVGNLGKDGREHTRIELGITAAGSPFGEYHGSRGPDANQDSGDNRYNAVFRNGRLGLKVALRDIGVGTHDPAWWEGSLNIWGGYNYERGRVGHNDPFAYRAKQETLTIGLRGQFALLFPFYGTGTDIQGTILRPGEVTPVVSGFMSKIDFVAEYQNALSTSRRTSITKGGGRDRQRNISYLGQVRLHVWRFVNETRDIREDWLWETDFVLIGHMEGARRYGFAQVRNNHYSNRFGGGAGIHLNINRSFFLQAEYIVMEGQRGTDRVIGQANVVIGYSW